MSELIKQNDNRATIRWKLLTGVSALALMAYVSSGAKAEDASQPQVWIELGGQAERIEGQSTILSPPFFSLASPAGLAAMTSAQQPSPFSFGLDGKITFQPKDSDWLFSASIRYGRSSVARHIHRQSATAIPAFTISFDGSPLLTEDFGKAVMADGQAVSRESHAIVDFQVGKDAGLGLFGGQGSSVVSAGVRFAQFTSSSHATLHARPIAYLGPPLTFATAYGNTVTGFRDDTFASYTALIRSKRNARAVGPSVSWTASLPIAGNSSDMTLNVDWGVNAAVLFGRQRTRVYHQTTAYGTKLIGFTPSIHRYTHTPPDQDRSRRVTIPNLGGFAGVSFHYADAKVSFGYRGDFFFNAMDTGIDTRKESTLGFFGPYASLSIGLGD